MEGYDAMADKDDLFNSRLVQFFEDCETHEEFDQIDNGYIWLDDPDITKATELRFKVQTFQKFMKKMGNNWSSRECINFYRWVGRNLKRNMLMYKQDTGDAQCLNYLNIKGKK
jgi:hypothetical protein